MKKRDRDFIKRHKNHVEYKYLPEFVYGGIDGAVTTFAVVVGAIGATLSSGVILILGFANLFADGFSMAVSNYLSTKSRNELSPEKAKHPLKSAFAIFVAFIIIGLIPLLSFLISLFTKNSNFISNQFFYSFILTGIALIIVGGVRGVITKKHPVRSAIETIVIGGVAAILAFIVGFLLKGLA